MQVSILGCGWLGLPLAKGLLAEGYIVKGSTTTEAKLNVVKTAGIMPFVISLAEEGITDNIGSFMDGSDVLIVDVPPKVKGGESYPQKIQHLIQHIKDAKIEKVLFVSSTSVYADDNTIVTEDTIPNPDSESGRQVLDAEQVLAAALPNSTILRFAGLIGEDRHPVYHLAGRKNIANPNALVNLIHREDCIGIIKAIIAKEAWGEIFNAAAPEHPTRKEYYTSKAEELGLEVPGFEEGKQSVGKTIASDKVINTLGYNFNSSI